MDGFRGGIESSGAEAELRLDADLLALIKQGTVKLEHKVTQIFEQLRGPVYHYLVAVFGDAAEAEDVAQEAFLQLYRSLHGGQAIGNVRCWVFRAAHNLAINRRKHQQFLAPLDDHSWEEIRQSLPDSALNPEQRVLQMERFERLHARLGRLSLQERQCLQLRVEGFRYREIAEILEISTPTVGEFLRRGIKKLMEENHG
ncbi:MAG TPA: RNA polymerase sigma factor [Blastocatellia bacterium]|nr:RNA polymerase sigma factor [Blastocatellia bacterium]